jgi:intron-binding protein aquarius
MNDFTGRIKREEWKPPKGGIRTIRVTLDTAQYHIDVTETAEKGTENVYGTFNILMRRKPKENKFKAILESIRDLMNETCVVPEWLHNIFLGYGNPSAAQWMNMPDLVEVIDFKDTFLDANHVQQSFPDYQVYILTNCFCFFGMYLFSFSSSISKLLMFEFFRLHLSILMVQKTCIRVPLLKSGYPRK